jgi:GntR family transcriptional regulator
VHNLSLTYDLTIELWKILSGNPVLAMNAGTCYLHRKLNDILCLNLKSKSSGMLTAHQPEKVHLTFMCTMRDSTHVIPFRVQFRAGLSLFEQVVYASKKAMVAGQLRPGDTFPSVRMLSKELKINPNTAAKIVAHLVNEGLLETRPGVGTVVAALPDSTRKERMQLLGQEIEEIVVEAKRLGIGLDEMLDSIKDHWKHLTREDMAGNKLNDGGRRER